MIDTYINIEKAHKEFDQHLKNVGVNKLVLKDIQSPKQIKLVVTSLEKILFNKILKINKLKPKCDIF